MQFLKLKKMIKKILLQISFLDIDEKEIKTGVFI